MTTLQPPSAKSSCCGAERTSHLEFIKEKNSKGRTNFYVCSKCGEEWKTSPYEGEMEKAREEKAYLTKISSTIDNAITGILSLQSRLKQAEAERESYRGDAERMAKTLEFIRTQDVPFETDTTLHLEARELADKTLSSLSNKYPSSK